MTFLIRGYGAPFNIEAMIEGEGVSETIAPGAFLLGNAVELRLWAHEGPKIASAGGAGGLHLFQDDYGLGFEARLAEDAFLIATVRAVRTEGFQASVYFAAAEDGSLRWDAQYAYEGERCSRRVRYARIDHIALAHGAAYGPATGAWVTDENGEDIGPPHPLAARWRAGHTERASRFQRGPVGRLREAAADRLTPGEALHVDRNAVEARRPHARGAVPAPPSVKQVLALWAPRAPSPEGGASAGNRASMPRRGAVVRRADSPSPSNRRAN